MIWRLVVLGLMSIPLLVGSLACALQAATFSDAAQKIYTTAAGGNPSSEHVHAASVFYSNSATLTMLVTPLAGAGFLTVLAILVILALRWDLVRPPAPSR